MTNEEIDKEIAKVKADKMVPDFAKTARIAQLEKQRPAKSSGEPKKPTKEKPPVAAKPAGKTGKKKAKVKKGEDFEINGKKINEVDCQELYKLISERLESAKKSAKKSRTKPVIEKVAKNIEQAAAGAIKNIPAKKINADPEKWAKKIKLVYDASKKYALELKDILGEDYDSAAVIEELAPILKFAQEIEKKK